VQAGVNSFVTNFYVQVWTNAGVRVAYLLEDGALDRVRSSSGLLTWSAGRFPGGMVNGTGNICATNLTTYLRTNGVETWILHYVTAAVPVATNWTSQGVFCSTFCDINGNNEWDGTGANPYGSSDYLITLNPQSIHRDISSLYANGVNGFVLQNVTRSQGGYFEQALRLLGGASLLPYYFSPGLISAINTDAEWYRWYGPGADIRPGLLHGMIVGGMLTTEGLWQPKRANDMNLLLTGSNESITPPAGATPTGVGWTMMQAKYHSFFLTNSFGYCHPAFGTDGFSGDSYSYNDWMSLFACQAFFQANIFDVRNFLHNGVGKEREKKGDRHS